MTKKVEKKMFRNFRNIRNIFKLRGIINSDIPMESRFVTPSQRVSHLVWS